MEAFDRVGEFFLGGFGEVVGLALVGRAGAVPEEEPLQGFGALDVVFESEGVVLVGEFFEV